MSLARLASASLGSANCRDSRLTTMARPLPGGRARPPLRWICLQIRAIEFTNPTRKKGACSDAATALASAARARKSLLDRRRLSCEAGRDLLFARARELLNQRNRRRGAPNRHFE